MTKKQIISEINDNGGFDNFNNWSRPDVAIWVMSNFDCSKYVASNVAWEIS